MLKNTLTVTLSVDDNNMQNKRDDEKRKYIHNNLYCFICCIDYIQFLANKPSSIRQTNTTKYTRLFFGILVTPN